MKDSCHANLEFTTHYHALDFITALEYSSKCIAVSHVLILGLTNPGTVFSRINEEIRRLKLRKGPWSALLPVPDTAKHPILPEMWRDKTCCDLTVVAGTREFQVHRSVLTVCTPFFKGACRPGGFKKSTTGRIELEEDESTIEIILQELYKSIAPSTHQCLPTSRHSPRASRRRSCSRCLGPL